jgi:hypothetical protein
MVTIHSQNHSAERGESLRNHATISLIVPGNTLRMSMDIHSADEPGFLVA